MLTGRRPKCFRPADGEELRLDLRAMLQRCRPDWDIISAEQRTAWDKGDKTRFHPHGKTRAQELAEQD